MRLSQVLTGCALCLAVAMSPAHAEKEPEGIEQAFMAVELSGYHPTDIHALCRQQKRYSNNKEWERWLFRLCEGQRYNELIPVRYTVQYAKRESRIAIELTLKQTRYLF